MVTREALLEAAVDDDPTLLLDIIKAHHATSDPFDVTELIASLSSKQLEDLWSNLQMKCTTTLLGINPDSEEEQQEKELEDACQFLQAVVLLAHASVDNIEAGKVPQTLFETAVILHGVLLTLPEGAEKLTNGIAKLCETWWHKNLDNRGELAGQTFVMLLQQALQPKATRASLKRVWSMRDYLSCVHLNNAASKTLKELLLQVPVSFQIFKFDEGRQFLGYLFSLNGDFTHQLHQVVKAHILSCPKAMLPHYGEVYLRAWKVANSSVKQTLEESCIQDLMYLAVHTSRGSAKSSPAACLRRVLGYFHKHKPQSGVDAMLLRLYDPILWRSLKVANSQVRANAAGLLFDAFPLQDPDNNLEQNDLLMQKQFDVIPTLLFDPCPTVRVVAIQGVAHICNVYWELIPAEVISDLLNKLANDLAWDGSSGEVRIAVLRAMTHILDNPLSHPLLKMVLPRLQNLLHDTSEQVRVTFCDMLLKVKGMRIIKFWTISPMEHLLAQLEVGTHVVSQRIVNLLFNSYLPLEKDQQTQITRIVKLIQTNPGASRSFFAHTYKHMSTSQTVKVILLLGRFVRQCVKKELQKQGADEDSGDEREDEEENADKENADEESELTIEDTDLMAGLLETILILWKSIDSQLQRESRGECRKWLNAYFGHSLPSFFKVFQDSRIVSCLVLIAGHLPANTIPTFSRSAVSKLRAMEEDSPVESYGTVLESMCHWGKAADIIELISEWLERTMDARDSTADQPNKSRRSGRTVMFEEPSDPKPLLALRYITYLTGHAICRDQLTTKNKAQTRLLTEVLKKVLKNTEKRFQSPEPLSELCSDKFLLQAFEVYCRLEILLHDPENREHNAITVVEHLLSWADVQLVPALKQRQRRRLLNVTNMTLMEGGDTCGESTLMSTTLLAPKRSAGEGQSPVLVELASDLLMKLLTVASNMLLVGVGDRELASHLADFATLLLKTEETVSTRFLPLISSLMYQVTEFTMTLERDGEDEGVGGQGNVVPDMLCKVTKMIATLAKAKREQAQRILPTVKPAFTEVLATYYRHQALLPDNDNNEVMSTIAEAMLSEMTSAIRKDNHMETFSQINELPLLNSFYLNIIAKKKNMMCMLLREFESTVKTCERMETLAGTAHLAYTLSKSVKFAKEETKAVVMATKLQLESILLPEDISEDAPIVFLKSRTNDVLKEAMTHLGGIL